VYLHFCPNYTLFLLVKKSLTGQDPNKLVKKTAKKMLDREHLYLVGKGTNYPAALEVSLKIKETSYLHAEAFAAGELKHGVIALIEKGTFCIVLINDGPDKQEVLSSAAQLKARGASIVGMASFENESFDIYLPIPNLGKLTAFAHIILGQLLGYYLGIGRGADPDKPRNLAKSVTVK